MTLVEFMVAIVIGMLIIAAMSTLIANQSHSRAEIDRSGKLIENGRYALSTIASDLQMTGYYGELSAAVSIASAAVLPDPCTIDPTLIEAAMGLPVQGYDSPAALPTEVQACVKNHRPGTDVIVVRRADPDTSDLETGGAVNWANLKDGQIYLQTGLDAGVLKAKLAEADAAPSAIFPYLRKDKVTKATPRRFLVRIYYVANCSVESGGSCTGADGGSPIPTLKRVDLTLASGAPVFNTITIAEGIENLQIDYGLDSDLDGVIDGADQSGATCNAGASNPACAAPGAFTTTDWSNVMAAKVHLIARGTEIAPGFTDTNSYVLGTAAPASAPAGATNYRRKVFSQSVRLVNPLGRRTF